jgi:uncharacterized protein (TIGR00369 family)
LIHAGSIRSNVHLKGSAMPQDDLLETEGVPPGFARHFRSSPVTDAWEPLYSKQVDHKVILGLRIAEPHTNARGLAHGGLISALADNAMGLTCASQFSTPHSLLTVNLSIDFMGMAKIGDWLEFDTTFSKVGSTLCFAQAYITANGTACAKAGATFRALPK